MRFTKTLAVVVAAAALGLLAAVTPAAAAGATPNAPGHCCPE